MQPIESPYITAKQAASYLCTSPNVLANWRCTRRYDLPYRKRGNSVLYLRSDVEKFAESRIVNPVNSERSSSAVA